MESATETQERTQKHFYSDWSLFALLVSNLIVIAWAVLKKWDIGEVLWVYWCQSVIIGFFWFFKLLSLKQFSTKDMVKDEIPVRPTKETKFEIALFFCMHFGIFHYVYLAFLTSSFASVKIVQILPLAIVFFIYQSFSFFYNRKWVETAKPNIGIMMGFPYARVIPMHFAIFFFGFFIAESPTEKSRLMLLLLVFFMLLKTLADVIMHAVERNNFSDW
jgi:hypothetical protein